MGAILVPVNSTLVIGKGEIDSTDLTDVRSETNLMTSMSPRAQMQIFEGDKITKSGTRSIHSELMSFCGVEGLNLLKKETILPPEGTADIFKMGDDPVTRVTELENLKKTINRSFVVSVGSQSMTIKGYKLNTPSPEDLAEGVIQTIQTDPHTNLEIPATLTLEPGWARLSSTSVDRLLMTDNSKDIISTASTPDLEPEQLKPESITPEPVNSTVQQGGGCNMVFWFDPQSGLCSKRVIMAHLTFMHVIFEPSDFIITTILPSALPLPPPSSPRCDFLGALQKAGLSGAVGDSALDMCFCFQFEVLSEALVEKEILERYVGELIWPAVDFHTSQRSRARTLLKKRSEVAERLRHITKLMTTDPMFFTLEDLLENADAEGIRPLKPNKITVGAWLMMVQFHLVEFKSPFESSTVRGSRDTILHWVPLTCLVFNMSEEIYKTLLPKQVLSNTKTRISTRIFLQTGETQGLIPFTGRALPLPAEVFEGGGDQDDDKTEKNATRLDKLNLGPFHFPPRPPLPATIITDVPSLKNSHLDPYNTISDWPPLIGDFIEVHQLMDTPEQVHKLLIWLEQLFTLKVYSPESEFIGFKNASEVTSNYQRLQAGSRSYHLAIREICEIFETLPGLRRSVLIHKSPGNFKHTVCAVDVMIRFVLDIFKACWSIGISRCTVEALPADSPWMLDDSHFIRPQWPSLTLLNVRMTSEQPVEQYFDELYKLKVPGTTLPDLLDGTTVVIIGGGGGGSSGNRTLPLQLQIIKALAQYIVGYLGELIVPCDFNPVTVKDLAEAQYDKIITLRDRLGLDVSVLESKSRRDSKFLRMERLAIPKLEVCLQLPNSRHNTWTVAESVTFTSGDTIHNDPSDLSGFLEYFFTQRFRMASAIKPTVPFISKNKLLRRLRIASAVNKKGASPSSLLQQDTPIIFGTVEGEVTEMQKGVDIYKEVGLYHTEGKAYSHDATTGTFHTTGNVTVDMLPLVPSEAHGKLGVWAAVEATRAINLTAVVNLSSRIQAITIEKTSISVSFRDPYKLGNASTSEPVFIKDLYLYTPRIDTTTTGHSNPFTVLFMDRVLRRMNEVVPLEDVVSMMNMSMHDETCFPVTMTVAAAAFKTTGAKGGGDLDPRQFLPVGLYVEDLLALKWASQLVVLIRMARLYNTNVCLLLPHPLCVSDYMTVPLNWYSNNLGSPDPSKMVYIIMRLEGTIPCWSVATPHLVSSGGGVTGVVWNTDIPELSNRRLSIWQFDSLDRIRSITGDLYDRNPLSKVKALLPETAAAPGLWVGGKIANRTPLIEDFYEYNFKSSQNTAGDITATRTTIEDLITGHFIPCSFTDILSGPINRMVVCHQLSFATRTPDYFRTWYVMTSGVSLNSTTTSLFGVHLRDIKDLRWMLELKQPVMFAVIQNVHMIKRDTDQPDNSMNIHMIYRAKKMDIHDMRLYFGVNADAIIDGYIEGLNIGLNVLLSDSVTRSLGDEELEQLDDYLTILNLRRGAITRLDDAICKTNRFLPSLMGGDRFEVVHFDTDMLEEMVSVNIQTTILQVFGIRLTSEIVDKLALVYDSKSKNPFDWLMTYLGGGPLCDLLEHERYPVITFANLLSRLNNNKDVVNHLLSLIIQHAATTFQDDGYDITESVWYKQYYTSAAGLYRKSTQKTWMGLPPTMVADIVAMCQGTHNIVTSGEALSQTFMLQMFSGGEKLCDAHHLNFLLAILELEVRCLMLTPAFALKSQSTFIKHNYGQCKHNGCEKLWVVSKKTLTSGSTVDWCYASTFVETLTEILSNADIKNILTMDHYLKLLMIFLVMHPCLSLYSTGRFADPVFKSALAQLETLWPRISRGVGLVFTNDEGMSEVQPLTLSHKDVAFATPSVPGYDRPADQRLPLWPYLLVPMSILIHRKSIAGGHFDALKKAWMEDLDDIWHKNTNHLPQLVIACYRQFGQYTKAAYATDRNKKKGSYKPLDPKKDLEVFAYLDYLIHLSNSGTAFDGELVKAKVLLVGEYDDDEEGAIQRYKGMLVGVKNPANGKITDVKLHPEAVRRFDELHSDLIDLRSKMVAGDKVEVEKLDEIKLQLNTTNPHDLTALKQMVEDSIEPLQRAVSDKIQSTAMLVEANNTLGDQIKTTQDSLEAIKTDKGRLTRKELQDIVDEKHRLLTSHVKKLGEEVTNYRGHYTKLEKGMGELQYQWNERTKIFERQDQKTEDLTAIERDLQRKYIDHGVQIEQIVRRIRHIDKAAELIENHELIETQRVGRAEAAAIQAQKEYDKAHTDATKVAVLERAVNHAVLMAQADHEEIGQTIQQVTDSYKKDVLPRVQKLAQDQQKAIDDLTQFMDSSDYKKFRLDMEAAIRNQKTQYDRLDKKVSEFRSMVDDIKVTTQTAQKFMQTKMDKFLSDGGDLTAQQLKLLATSEQLEKLRTTLSKKIEEMQILVAKEVTQETESSRREQFASLDKQTKDLSTRLEALLADERLRDTQTIERVKQEKLEHERLLEGMAAMKVTVDTCTQAHTTLATAIHGHEDRLKVVDANMAHLARLVEQNAGIITDNAAVLNDFIASMNSAVSGLMSQIQEIRQHIDAAIHSTAVPVAPSVIFDNTANEAVLLAQKQQLVQLETRLQELQGSVIQQQAQLQAQEQKQQKQAETLDEMGDVKMRSEEEDMAREAERAKQKKQLDELEVRLTQERETALATLRTEQEIKLQTALEQKTREFEQQLTIEMQKNYQQTATTSAAQMETLTTQHRAEMEILKETIRQAHTTEVKSLKETIEAEQTEKLANFSTHLEKDIANALVSRDQLLSQLGAQLQAIHGEVQQLDASTRLTFEQRAAQQNALMQQMGDALHKQVSKETAGQLDAVKNQLQDMDAQLRNTIQENQRVAQEDIDNKMEDLDKKLETIDETLTDKVAMRSLTLYDLLTNVNDIVPLIINSYSITDEGFENKLADFTTQFLPNPTSLEVAIPNMEGLDKTAWVSTWRAQMITWLKLMTAQLVLSTIISNAAITYMRTTLIQFVRPLSVALGNDEVGFTDALFSMLLEHLKLYDAAMDASITLKYHTERYIHLANLPGSPLVKFKGKRVYDFRIPSVTLDQDAIGFDYIGEAMVSMNLSLNYAYPSALTMRSFKAWVISTLWDLESLWKQVQDSKDLTGLGELLSAQKIYLPNNLTLDPDTVKKWIQRGMAIQRLRTSLFLYRSRYILLDKQNGRDIATNDVISFSQKHLVEKTDGGKIMVEPLAWIQTQLTYARSLYNQMSPEEDVVSDLCMAVIGSDLDVQTLSGTLSFQRVTTGGEGGEGGDGDGREYDHFMYLWNLMGNTLRVKYENVINKMEITLRLARNVTADSIQTLDTTCLQAGLSRNFKSIKESLGPDVLALFRGARWQSMDDIVLELHDVRKTTPGERLKTMLAFDLSSFLHQFNSEPVNTLEGSGGGSALLPNFPSSVIFSTHVARPVVNQTLSACLPLAVNYEGWRPAHYVFINNGGEFGLSLITFELNERIPPNTNEHILIGLLFIKLNV